MHNQQTAKLACSIAICLLNGCKNNFAGKNSVPVSALHWQTLTSNAGGFTISMPGEPEFKDAPNNTHKYLVHLDGFDQIYAAIYVDLPRSVTDPSEIDKLLKLMGEAELQKQQIAAPDSTIPVTVQGQPGLDVKFHSLDRQGKTGTATMRFLVVKSKAYELVSLLSNGKGSDLDRDQFLNSFKLK